MGREGESGGGREGEERGRGRGRGRERFSLLHDRGENWESVLFADHQLLVVVRHVASDVGLETIEEQHDIIVNNSNVHVYIYNIHDIIVNNSNVNLL